MSSIAGRPVGLAHVRRFADSAEAPGFKLPKLLGVVGAGQMGSGIALTAANVAEIPTVIYDASEAALTRSRELLEKELSKRVTKGKMTEAGREAVLGRLRFSGALEALGEADFVVEAISEEAALKQALFARLSALTRPAAVLASNTSSISITKLAAATTRPESVIGMHFFHPVAVMPLVEIVRGAQTEDATLARTTSLALAMQKQVTHANDSPGFISNRILMPYINEAVFALMERVGTAADIDATMKLGTNVPMGPLELADFIGLDTVLHILNVLHSQIGDPKFRPCPLLRQYVDAGWLGRKAGRGFYLYGAAK
eukprot:tig00000237_g20498.t1